MAIGTLALTVVLYVVDPQGLLPGAGHRGDPGHLGAPRPSRSTPWRSASRRWPAAILKDPDVVSLTSFIGVDGTNTTLNTGRFLINLKPKDERSAGCDRDRPPAAAETADVPGMQLYMQPVQDLTIDASVSRTQYQFVLEDPNLTAVNTGCRSWWRSCSNRPSCTNIASDLQKQGLEVDLAIDRATAARFGITPATVDDALYDAFGQRIISTIYTQSNQYRVIMEARSVTADLARLAVRDLPAVVGLHHAARCRCRAIVHVEQKPGPLQISHLGQFPATTISFDTAPGRRWARR